MEAPKEKGHFEGEAACPSYIWHSFRKLPVGEMAAKTEPVIAHELIQNQQLERREGLDLEGEKLSTGMTNITVKKGFKEIRFQSCTSGTFC